MNDTGVAAKHRSALDAQFPGQRFIVFCREGDGPDRDISEVIRFSTKDAFSRTGYPPIAVATEDDTAAGGSAEFLRVEVCGSGDGGCGGGGGSGCHRSLTRGAVSLWAVGRVSLRVEARLFDRNLGEDRQVAAGAAFMTSWAFTLQVRARRRRVGATVVSLVLLAATLSLSMFFGDAEKNSVVACLPPIPFTPVAPFPPPCMHFNLSAYYLTSRTQHLRGLNSARAAALRSRANAEAKLMARVSCGLRLCSLDRACGEEVADTVGNTALTQALAAALRLPSRFSQCGSSSSWSTDCHRSGAYVQAAKVRTGVGRVYERAIVGRESVYCVRSNNLRVVGCPFRCSAERRKTLEHASQRVKVITGPSYCF